MQCSTSQISEIQIYNGNHKNEAMAVIILAVFLNIGNSQSHLDITVIIISSYCHIVTFSYCHQNFHCWWLLQVRVSGNHEMGSGEDHICVSTTSWNQNYIMELGQYQFCIFHLRLSSTAFRAFFFKKISTLRKFRFCLFGTICQMYNLKTVPFH